MVAMVISDLSPLPFKFMQRRHGIPFVAGARSKIPCACAPQYVEPRCQCFLVGWESKQAVHPPRSGPRVCRRTFSYWSRKQCMPSTQSLIPVFCFCHTIPIHDLDKSLEVMSIVWQKPIHWFQYWFLSRHTCYFRSLAVMFVLKLVPRSPCDSPTTLKCCSAFVWFWGIRFSYYPKMLFSIGMILGYHGHFDSVSFWSEFVGIPSLFDSNEVTCTPWLPRPRSSKTRKSHPSWSGWNLAACNKYSQSGKFC